MNMIHSPQKIILHTSLVRDAMVNSCMVVRGIGSWYDLQVAPEKVWATGGDAPEVIWQCYPYTIGRYASRN